MSGIEIGIGVISAVAALITAYKDGHKIADRIKTWDSIPAFAQAKCVCKLDTLVS